MSGFLYFKPGEPAVNPAKAKDWGLGYAFSTRAAGGQCQGQTPSGGAGIVFADKNRMGESPVKMDMPNQVWGKIPKSDVWVGYWKDAPPKPDDLIRVNQLAGWPATLSGESKWTVPLVRKFDRDIAAGVPALPCYMTCDDDGNWVPGKVQEVHAKLWDAVSPFADDMISQMNDPEYQPVDFPANQIYGTATELLQTNYVVGPGELSLLQVFAADGSAQNAILFACDFPTFWAWNEEQKKSEGQSETDGLISSSGEAA